MATLFPYQLTAMREHGLDVDTILLQGRALWVDPDDVVHRDPRCSGPAAQPWDAHGADMIAACIACLRHDARFETVAVLADYGEMITTGLDNAWKHLPKGKIPVAGRGHLGRAMELLVRDLPRALDRLPPGLAPQHAAMVHAYVESLWARARELTDVVAKNWKVTGPHTHVVCRTFLLGTTGITDERLARDTALAGTITQISPDRCWIVVKVTAPVHDRQWPYAVRDAVVGDLGPDPGTLTAAQWAVFTELYRPGRSVSAADALAAARTATT